MASSTIRKAIGAVKDQTSISLAKVAGNVAPDIEVLIVKATSHDNEPADDKYALEIMNRLSYSRGYNNACVLAIAKRLSKTRDWIVALKALMLVHKLLNDGGPLLGQELMFLASRKGTGVLNMSDFRDEAHSNSWDHSGFVRKFASYLDQKLEFMVFERKLSVGEDEKKSYDDRYGQSRDEPDNGMENEVTTPIKELGPERVLEKLNQLLRLLDRFLASRPTGAAKNTRVVLVALYELVKESFRLYADISDALKYLLNSFSELEYDYSLKAFDAYVNAAKMIDELVIFYSWCKDEGVARSSEFPNVQKINDELLGKLEGLLREKRIRPKSPNKTREETSSDIKEKREGNIYEIKALPPPQNYNPSNLPQLLNEPRNQQPTEDLVNLKDNGVSADQHGNNLALALFSAETNDEWIDFSKDGETKVASAWENPAAEIGKADWELVLVESASNLSKQQADLAGGFDSLLLNGMYDQGTVRQHASNSEVNGGSASSVALPGFSKTTTQVLALPAPDGTVGQQDPFAASLCVPPPSYVQIVDMERKQHLLTREQQLWQQYSSDGMRGQMGMGKIGGNAGYYDAANAMPYGGYYASY